MRRRGFLPNGTFLAVATMVPSQDWLLSVLDATEPRPGSRIGEHQVSMIREAFTDFLEASVMRGGGYARARAHALLGDAKAAAHAVAESERACEPLGPNGRSDR
jgi:hypothetical protein